MRWEVEGNGQMFVLLNGGAEPLLAVFCKVVMRQERHGERDVRFGWCKITEKEGFVDDVESSAAAWFFEIGGWRRLRGRYGGRCAVVLLLQRRLLCVW